MNIRPYTVCFVEGAYWLTRPRMNIRPYTVCFVEGAYWLTRPGMNIIASD
jgi:hypothetical protein